MKKNVNGLDASRDESRILGTSPATRFLQQGITSAARVDSTVLLLGESGTGKEVAATAIHLASARRDWPFIVVDCGALAENLVESELFGHDKGAFTSATASRKGAFVEAERGTVFLDEIGELPLALQPRLLRVLSRRHVKPLGGARYTDIDVRVVAATNRDLWSEVQAGRFRADLYYRLAILELHLPPLRERTEDIPALIEDFARELAGPVPLLEKLLAPEHLAVLQRQLWPGNIRELRNYVERCIAYGEALRPGARMSSSPPEIAPAPEIAPIHHEQPVIDPRIPIREARVLWNRRFEYAYLQALLEHHGGNVRAAARATGLDRAQLYRLLRKHALR